MLYILEDLGVENVGMEKITGIWYIWYILGIHTYFVFSWNIFPIMTCCTQKIWQP
jgi:hypothetical protein